MNMTKATVNYRQEKSHMMGAVDRSFTDQSTLQEDERLGLSFMDAPGYSPRGKYWPSQPPGSQVTGRSPAFCVLMLAQKCFKEYVGLEGLSGTLPEQQGGDEHTLTSYWASPAHHTGVQ